MLKKPFPEAYVELNKNTKIWKGDQKSFKTKHKDKLFTKRDHLKKNKLIFAINHKDGMLLTKES